MVPVVSTIVSAALLVPVLNSTPQALAAVSTAELLPAVFSTTLAGVDAVTVQGLSAPVPVQGFVKTVPNVSWKTVVGLWRAA
jgi:hypothetical protein